MAGAQPSGRPHALDYGRRLRGAAPGDDAATLASGGTVILRNNRDPRATADPVRRICAAPRSDQQCAGKPIGADSSANTEDGRPIGVASIELLGNHRTRASTPFPEPSDRRGERFFEGERPRIMRDGWLRMRHSILVVPLGRARGRIRARDRISCLPVTPPARPCSNTPQAHCAPGPLAQLAEQQTLNLRVEGSIPSRLTIFSSALSDGAK
jgi:hypothetical protein